MPAGVAKPGWRYLPGDVLRRTDDGINAVPLATGYGLDIISVGFPIGDIPIRGLPPDGFAAPSAVAPRPPDQALMRRPIKAYR